MISKIDHDRLKEIREEMMDLLQEATDLIKQSDKVAYEGAKSYWIGAIDVGLGGGNFVDTHSHTMEKTIKDLDPGDDEDEDEEDLDED